MVWKGWWEQGKFRISVVLCACVYVFTRLVFIVFVNLIVCTNIERCVELWRLSSVYGHLLCETCRVEFQLKTVGR